MSHSMKFGWSYRESVTKVTSKLVTISAIILLVTGWYNKEFAYITPEFGLGYFLGVTGGVMMLVLTLYPLRKNLSSMKNLGPVRHWFRMHLLFGVFGPIAILYHCNFKTGAINSNIALWSMIIVASSGFIGRYFYSRIHKGLYGREVSLNELKNDWLTKNESITDIKEVKALEKNLHNYETFISSPDKQFFVSLLRAMKYPIKRYFFKIKIRQVMQLRIKQVKQRDLDMLQQRLSSAAAVYRHIAFGRLFHLWHLLHMPLFFMLIITGIVHVLAVHMY